MKFKVQFNDWKDRVKSFFDLQTIFLLLLVSCFCFCIFYFYLPKAFSRTLSRSVANTITIFLLVRLAYPLRIPALLYVSFVAALNVSCIYMYGGVLHDGMMVSVLETHYVEAK